MARTTGTLLAASAMVERVALALWREDRLMETGVWSDTGWASADADTKSRYRRRALAAVVEIMEPEALKAIE